MKAIYINLDSYLQAVAAWIKGGKSGEAPKFSSLPLAVTIPAGQTAAVYAQTGTAAKTADAGSAVTGITWTFSPSLGDAIATGVAPGMSQVLASETASVYAVAGDGFTATATIKNGDTTVGTFSVHVVVNRETLDGPVDLVDFTPPAAAIAAGTDLKGTKFDGNEIVAAAGTGALSAPAGS